MRLLGIAFALVLAAHYQVDNARASVVFEETFEDGIANNITQHFGNHPYLISSGLGGSTYGLASQDEYGSGLVIGLDDVVVGDARIEADFQLRNQRVGDFEVLFSRTGISSANPLGEYGYKVAVHPDGSDTPDFITKSKGEGVPVDFLYTGPHFFGTFDGFDEVNLTVERLNGSIDTFINDVPYMSATDATWGEGAIFFRIFGPGTIDNIRVTDLSPIPEPASIAIWSLLAVVGFVVARRRKCR